MTDLLAASATSTNPDAYEAGREIGEALAQVRPEAVIIFTSIHHDFAEQYTGIIDGLGHDALVFGTTGDGFVETRSQSDLGVAALGLNAEGHGSFGVSVGSGLKVDTPATVARVAEELRAQRSAPLTYAFVSTSIGTDGALAARALNDSLKVPFSGGIAGDDRKFVRGLVLSNGVAHEDSIGMLGLFGDVSVAIAAASGWSHVGATATVDAADGTTVRGIGGTSALNWVAKQLGSSRKIST